MRKPRINEQQEDFIKKNAPQMSFSQLSEKLNIPVPTLQVYCERSKIVTKYTHSEKKDKFRQHIQKIQRPPAVYNQSASPYGIANSLHNISLIQTCC